MRRYRRATKLGDKFLKYALAPLLVLDTECEDSVSTVLFSLLQGYKGKIWLLYYNFTDKERKVLYWVTEPHKPDRLP